MDFMLFNKCFTCFGATAKCAVEWGWESGEEIVAMNACVLEGERQRCVFITQAVLFKFYLFIYLWLCWVFVSVWGLSLVVANGGHSASRCAGLSLSRPLLLWSTSSRRAGSVIVAHGPSCSADQGSNPCPLHWQADSQPLRHQGSPLRQFLFSPKFSSLWLSYHFHGLFPRGPFSKNLTHNCSHSE